LKKRIIVWIGFLSLFLLLAGCNQMNQPITPESTGIWNQYVVYPLSWLLKEVAHLLGGSYGWSLIVVTILVRLVIAPLMVKQMKSAKAMQALQPEIQKLKEKYSSKDQKTQQKFQQEQMALFQKHGVNPMAGCLPLLIQMPILIGFYHAISRTREIAQDSFLWFDLGKADPYYILPLIAAVTTYIQQKMTMAGTEQNPQMAMMTWMMPIMIFIFAFKFPAALSLYWVVGNIFMIVQTYFIKGPELKQSAVTGKARGAKK
jgi:YidC/Oxa1 family membrane protein insertase